MFLRQNFIHNVFLMIKLLYLLDVLFSRLAGYATIVHNPDN